jgi:hypothetical protein
MNELDEATMRAHVRRRAVGPVEEAKVEGLTRSIMVRVDARPRSLRRRLATAPIAARVGLAAALVVAISLIAVPFAGGPRASTLPLAGSAATGSMAPSTPDPGALQVLTLDQLQRVAALGDAAPYAGHIVVAAVDVIPDPRPITCLPGDCPLGFIDGADPEISVVEAGDIVRGRIGGGVTGPVILRLRGINHAEFLGNVSLAAGSVAWPLPSFIWAQGNLPRTMELSTKFGAGPPFVVVARLVQGNAIFCAFQTPATDPLAADFSCGLTGWLAPAELADPTTILDGWTSRPADWVRVQNGAYSEFVAHGEGAGAIPTAEPVLGFYLVYPVLKLDPGRCFQCDAGAVAILAEKLEPVPVP